jgi:hypothetical protein
LSFSFGTIAGSTPNIAGHHIAFKIPNRKPITTKSGTEAKAKMNDAALMATKRLPSISVPPTIRFRLNLSPITPPKSINAIMGNRRANITMLKSFPVAPLRLSTPYASAISDNPLPKLEIKRAEIRETKPL